MIMFPGALTYSTKTLMSGKGPFPLNFWSGGVEETPQNNIGYHHCPWLPPRNVRLDHCFRTKTDNRCHSGQRDSGGRL